ncbi:MAG: hypothetical protein AABW47_00865 [Nanoarchaeota archaeon]
MNINDRIKDLNPENQKKFEYALSCALESPRDYPEIYAVHKIDKINPDVRRVKEILYQQMFEKKAVVS